MATTTRFAVKALRGLRNRTRINNLSELPPSVTAVFKRDPRQREAFEKLLQRYNEEGQANTRRRMAGNDANSVSHESVKRGVRVVNAVHLNIPRISKATEESVKSMMDPKLRVFEEWKKLYAELIDNKEDVAKDFQLSPMTMALNITEDERMNKLDDTTQYSHMSQLLDDYAARGNMVPSDFNAEQKTPKESDMFSMVKKYIIDPLEEEEEDVENVGEVGHGSKATTQSNENLAFSLDDDDDDHAGLDLAEKVLESDPLMQSRNSNGITEAWSEMDYEQKRKLYTFLLFVEHSEFLAKEEARKKRQQAITTLLTTLEDKVKEMKNIKKRDYQLPEHDYDIVFLDEQKASWKSRSQEERDLLQTPITIMKRQLESMAEKMTIDAPDNDPATAMQEFNKFERVLNVFMSRAMGMAIDNSDVLDVKPMKLPTDVLPDEMQWQRLPFHHRLQALFDAVVERSEPVEQHAERIIKLQEASKARNQGRSINQRAKSNYPVQFSEAMKRLQKRENKKMRTLCKRYDEHVRKQVTNAVEKFPFGKLLSRAMSKNAEVQELAQDLESFGASLPQEERLSNLNNLVKMQSESWNDARDMLCGVFPELKNIFDMLSVTTGKLEEQRMKMAKIDSQIIPEQIRAKHFPEGKTIEELNTEYWAERIANSEVESRETNEQHEAKLYAAKTETDELASVIRQQSSARLRLAEEYDEFLRQTLSKEKYGELLQIVDQVIAKANQKEEHKHIRPFLVNVKKSLVDAGTGAFFKRVKETEKQFAAVLNQNILTDDRIQSKVKEFGYQREMLQVMDMVKENIEKRGLVHLITPAVTDRLLAVNKKYHVQLEQPSPKKDYLKNDPNRDLKPKRVLESVTTMGHVHEGMKYPGDSIVKLHVKLSDMQLSDRAKDRLLAIAGYRYKPASDTLILRGDTFPEKQQNIVYVDRLLVELIKEAKKADEDEAYVVEKAEILEPTPLELLSQGLSNVEAEEEQSEEAFAVWRRIRKTGKAYVGADQTYQEGVVDEAKVDKSQEPQQHELGYMSAFDEDDEESFLFDESLTMAGAAQLKKEEKERQQALQDHKKNQEMQEPKKPKVKPSSGKK